MFSAVNRTSRDATSQMSDITFARELECNVESLLIDGLSFQSHSSLEQINGLQRFDRPSGGSTADKGPPAELLPETVLEV